MNELANPSPEGSQVPDPPLPPLPWNESIEVILARYERRLLDHALAQAGGVKRRAAMLLGISRYALERRLTRVAKTLDNKTDTVGPGSESPHSPSGPNEQASAATQDN